MAKNNSLIEKYKYLHKTANQITPKIYAAMALALHRKYGWGHKRINDLFMESQYIWEESINSSVDMLKMCEDEIGIEVTIK